MRVQINDTIVNIPSSLSEFTLGQRIDFYNQYGKGLDERGLKCEKMEAGIDKELERIEINLDIMFKSFAFFSGIDENVLKESEFVDTIAAIYHSSIASLFAEQSDMDLQTEFEWNGKIWKLYNPEMKQESRMKFGELIDAKQTIQNMEALGYGRWEAMLSLCAIFLRPEGEEYDECFLYENSERLQLMRDLPMSIALQVGFFLSVSLNIYTSSFLFSTHQD